MAQPLIGFLVFALGTVIVLTVPVLAVWILVQVFKGVRFVVGGGFKGVGMLVRHVARFVRGEVVDTLHFAGSVLTGACIAPLALANVGIGRIRAAKHYGAALEDEFTSALVSLYRVGLGHPVRLVGLGALTDGLERRLPELVADEPRTTRAVFERPKRMRKMRTENPEFEGYKIAEELRAGGSGARLFRATPTSDRAQLLKSRRIDVPSQVVIKAFDIGYGSTIPQIVRESRSLEAAKRLGLIIEHEIGDDAFHYVMPFVPGQDLDELTREMHAKSGNSGLDGKSLKTVLALSRDLCSHLDRFHGEGLWHKDIKPSNLLVAEGRLHVVDFGLATPLESALTLTTHGTEFFRDPELVRLALAGKRVKDVDGVKFDLYSAGAVLYSMVENSFPAHGSLSSISKRSPEALRWIVRRAMADVDKRYASANAMARDLEVLALARDPYRVRPADLPSVRGEVDSPPPIPKEEPRGWRAGLAGVGAALEDLDDIDVDDFAMDDDDVKRFEALGGAVEIHGMKRMRSAMAASRAKHRARRQAKSDAKRARKESKAAAKLASNRAPDSAQPEVRERRKRRGMLKMVAVIAIFAGMAGGAVAIKEARENHHWSRYAHAMAQSAPNVAVVRPPQAPSFGGPSLGSNLQQSLREFGKRARILVVSDPADVRLDDEVMGIAKELRAVGLRPRGVAFDDEKDMSELEVSLLGTARYAIDKAHGSIQRASQNLSDLVRQHRHVDGVLWLTRDDTTGYVRSVLVGEGGAATSGVEAFLSATGEAPDDECEDECSIGCDVDTSCTSKRGWVTQ